MTLHLKSRGYPFRPRLLFSCFIVVGVGFPTVYYFRRGQSYWENTPGDVETSPWLSKRSTILDSVAFDSRIYVGRMSFVCFKKKYYLWGRHRT